MAATITTPPAPTKITRPDAETSDKTENEPPFNVVLLDDNDHTFAYVIEMLRAIFGYPAPKGHGMAREVHTTGRVIVETTHKELAELRQEQIHVTALTKANVYFDGQVVSHTLLAADGSKKTLGLIFRGKFHFDTDKAERMEIVAGACAVKVKGEAETQVYAAGAVFEIPARSSFDIAVANGICEYICSFLD